MNMTLVSLLVDIALGGMAYHLALKLSKVQEKQTYILDQLVSRVARLENGHNRPVTLGFAPVSPELELK